MDTSGNGLITKRELRETLYKFILPMKKGEFIKLWNKYVTCPYSDWPLHLTCVILCTL